MNIGDIVGLVELVDGVLTKVPAIVVKEYHNVHDEVVADLHRLKADVTGVVSKEGNPTEALPVGGVHVTTDLSPITPEDQAAASQIAPPAAPSPTPAPSAQLSEEERAFGALSPEDQASFLEWQKSQTTEGTGSGSTTGATGEGAPS